VVSDQRRNEAKDYSVRSKGRGKDRQEGNLLVF